jgi:hypothetical protein
MLPSSSKKSEILYSANITYRNATKTHIGAYGRVRPMCGHMDEHLLRMGFSQAFSMCAHMTTPLG